MSLLGAVVASSVAVTAADTGTSVVAADPGSTVVGELVHVMAEDESPVRLVRTAPRTG
ncbi:MULTISPECIES: hypothetical protein [unclassified Modestobacter]|uniref:hypothetical protein n=1 Tax=unclassified Modestobacter TaxID=2643866 RepID=UPI0022AA9B09|nr:MULTISPECIES: hypothetical protein [unclassified Modestobacter]MCZ2823743.1 hypothetical protein [Modestobacter sp. VKM Ac-2981]MCZ2851988.1 hypothetical protein [Modestobacter sp. VKM Ac-2982]